MLTAECSGALERSLREHTVLTGRVIDVVFGAETVGDGVTVPLGSDYFVITWHETVEIRVPLDRFSNIDLEQKNRRQNASTGKSTPLSTTMKRYLLNRKGSEFDFIVTKIPYDDDGLINGPILADRLIAMDKVRREFWFARDEEENYFAAPDRVFDARIVDVAHDSIRVELKGIERILYRDSLTLQEHEEVFERYKVGNTIPVRIVKVTLRDEEQNLVKARLRQAKEYGA